MFKLLNKSEPSLKKQAYLLFVGKAFFLAVQLFVPVILVRLLTKTEFGLYRISTVVAFTLLEILSLGLNSSLYYFYPISDKRKTQLLAQTFYMLFVIGCVVVLGYFTVYQLLDNYFSFGIRKDIALPTILLTVFLLISSSVENIFILEGKALLNSVYIFGETVARFLFTVLPILYFRSAYHALWGLVVFSVLRTVFLLGYYNNNYKGFFAVADPGYIREQLKYVIPFAGGLVVGEIGKKIDRFIVSGIVGVTQFATYSVAFFSIPYLNIVFDSMFRVAMPKLSVYCADRDLTSARDLWHKVIFSAALVTIPSVVFFEVMAEPVTVILFTKDYVDCVPPYRILLLMLFFQMTGYGLILRAHAKTDIIFRASLVTLFVGAASGVLLTYSFGLVGAAVSALLSFGTFSTIILYAEKKILELPVCGWMPFRKLFDILLISLVCALPLVLLTLLPVRLSYFVTVPASFVIYALAVLCFYQVRTYVSVGTLIGYVAGKASFPWMRNTR